MEKLEQTPMSYKVKDRIEADADKYVKQFNWRPSYQDVDSKTDYIAGATAERPIAWNEAIDACIEIFRSAPWDQNIIPLVEKLKHKQP